MTFYGRMKRVRKGVVRIHLIDIRWSFVFKANNILMIMRRWIPFLAHSCFIEMSQQQISFLTISHFRSLYPLWAQSMPELKFIDEMFIVLARIRSDDLWSRSQLLYQLSHNHCQGIYKQFGWVWLESLMEQCIVWLYGELYWLEKIAVGCCLHQCSYQCSML